ncbi:hypothetical protein LJC24_01580, partial [Desulfococcaceae bacterium OttesenSCG-928-F15]|nr:hypothetical protein [Desulfococcaceae bacterium OttesenSCG-928-F15]
MSKIIIFIMLLSLFNKASRARQEIKTKSVKKWNPLLAIHIENKSKEEKHAPFHSGSSDLCAGC